MTHWRVAVLAVLLTACCPIFAKADFKGTQKEQAACRPDVRKFCRSLKPGAGSLVFLSCLKKNRAKLSKACDAVLKSHGQ